MSTPSTATATLPHQSSHYGYSHHQSYQTGAPAYLSNNSLMNGTSRMATQYNYAAVPTLSTSTTGLPTYKSTSELATPQSHTSDLQGRNMPSDDGRTESTSARKRRRSKPTDWNDFYKNGLPKEVIVIDESPEPQIRESPDPNVVAQLQYQNGRAVAANSRPAVKKRKRDAVYDPVHSAHAGPSNQSPHYVDSKTGSTISTDRTTSAINTTAATSLGSQYSNSNGSKGYAPDDTQPGKKRKRVTTRQQFAEEAKRREAEVNGDAFTNYQPPPRPPIKAAEVTVKVMHDVSTIGGESFSSPFCLQEC
jgi:dual-specificity kinase